MSFPKKGSSKLPTLKPVGLSGPELKKMILNCRPSDCSGAYKFKWDYLEKEILSKYVGPDTLPADVRASKAIDKLLESEKSCKDINENGYGSRCKNLNSLLFRAKSIISHVLGEFSPSLYERSSFSGGASTSRKFDRGHPFYKYHNKWPTDVTPSAYNRAYALITATPLWCVHGGWHNLKLKAGNSITTVPKKTDIDRAIAKEPDLNMHMQRALGAYVRRRLKKWNIDLDDQARNQRLALIGSVTNSLSTIDLSCASDSISSRLVWDLLPPRWFEEFEALRSPYGTLPNGKLLKWEKFSAMGNGYTFELESLLFFALAQAVLQESEGSPNCTSFPHNVSVYGDDIIIPKYCTQVLIDLLDDVGFKTNVDKSFSEGPFRESCGKHYYTGIDVTPFYIRKDVDHASRVIWLLNRLRLWSYDISFGICDPSLEPLWLKLRRTYIPACLLGGRDINSITAVYSPEEPRFVLLNKVKMNRIGGWRALLASLQDLNDYPLADFQSVMGIRHSSELVSYGTKASIEAGYIPIVIDQEWRYRPNDIPHWCQCEILFPKEIQEVCQASPLEACGQTLTV